MSQSPYAPPKAIVIDDAKGYQTEFERVRREHLTTEAQLKSLGTLYCLGGTVMAVAGPLMIVGVGARSANELASMLRIGIATVIIAALCIWLGYGYRNVKPWVKIPGTIVAAIGLINIPIGTVLGIAILYWMYSAQGQTVLSADYQNIIASTPHVKYQRSVLEWIMIGAVLVGLALFVVIVFIIPAFQ